MERKIIYTLFIMILLPSLCFAKINLEVLNPRTEIEPQAISNPMERIGDLTGKKIGLYWNRKSGGNNFWDEVEKKLKEKYPTATILRYEGAFDLGEALAKKMAKEVDVFMYGVGDWGSCTWAGGAGAPRLEQAGRPGVYVVTDNFIHDAKASVVEHGMPAMRIVTVPAKEYYVKRVSKKEIETVADKVIDHLINAVTQPLTKEELQVEAKKETVTKAMNVTGINDEEALEKFNQLFLENKWGDGLPLVPPTPERVKWMLRGTSRSPQEVIGKVLPKKGVLTVEKIAINAVMAGARPEYLPVIVAAMEALTDKDYDLLHVQTSTGSFSLAIVVSGPIAKEIGVYSGIGVLGYGWRPNNTIGRAVRLCLINGGHVWPGENDMALVGRQSSHTFYTLAENHDYSPWEPYHVTQGFKPEDSCVSVFTVGGTVMSPYQKYGLSVYGGGSVRPWTVEQILVTIVNELKAAYRSDITKWRKATAIPSPPHLVLVVEPVFAMESERMKYTRKTLQEYIYKNAAFPYEELTAEEVAAIKRRIDAGEIPQENVNTFKEALKQGGKVPLLDSPDDIHIIVSGGIPSYTFGWTYFSKPIYAPNGHKTKLIRR